MKQQAKGTFEVKLESQPSQETFDGEAIDRMTIEKQFAGDMVGTSLGQMLAFHTGTKGSAGYVAIETIAVQLGDRTGRFTLQHSCFMSGGSDEQYLTVIPDSGTKELTGIQGQMSIAIDEQGGHFYTFDYMLPS